ncbi:MAG TPA: thioredoxin-disulfide reductase [Patescibacteria group bacterium]|nr:thioredoxin-disulfide reductase [Patescibacteria group bacterium]
MSAPQTHNTKVLIIGSGPAGYTAAIYTARANLKPLLVAGMQPGGQMTVTSDVENYPGFAAPINGPWLMDQMKMQAEHVGTEMITDTIVSIDLNSNPKKAVGDSGDIYLADAVIIATGAQAKWLGIPSEQTYKGKGVSACATCDGFFYKNKEVVVVGGGNSAVEEALFLTNFATKVTVVHRRDSFRAEKIMQDRLFKHPKINVIWDSEVEEVTGDTGVTGVKLKNIKTGAVTDLKTDGVFVAIGHKPATDLFKGQVTIDNDGYIVTKPDSTQTNIDGVFAAGDVKDKVFRQAVTAAGMGAMAALEADKYLAHLEAQHNVAPAKKTANGNTPKP